ncbi:MAG: pyrophosphate--fructose-6-phosphate 1-phosphotransferase, partial [Opitutales bacterium]|nr:pyrophosphate--fructose-6-phosphate 1-phosphotransferase [Opitutales bacterium]
GWLAAFTAYEYRKMLGMAEWADGFGLSKRRRDVHAIFIPEMEIDIAKEAARLKKIMDEEDCVNIFISEGAGVETIVKEMEAKGESVPRDAFGHVKLDAVNPGKWFGGQFAEMLGAEKVLVQKSGYFARAAASNKADLNLIKSCADLAVECAMKRVGGVIGHDEDQGCVLRAIEFERIKGGKPFNTNFDWFKKMLSEIGQA